MEKFKPIYVLDLHLRCFKQAILSFSCSNWLHRAVQFSQAKVNLNKAKMLSLKKSVQKLDVKKVTSLLCNWLELKLNKRELFVLN